jgi:hypothetical protein
MAAAYEIVHGEISDCTVSTTNLGMFSTSSLALRVTTASSCFLCGPHDEPLGIGRYVLNDDTHRLPIHVPVSSNRASVARPEAHAAAARVVGAGKSIQSQKGTERCMTKPDGKAVVSSCGTRVGKLLSLRNQPEFPIWFAYCQPAEHVHQ